MAYYWFSHTIGDVLTLDESCIRVEETRIYPRQGFRFDDVQPYLDLQSDPVFCDEAAAYDYASRWAVEQQDGIDSEIKDLHFEKEYLERKEKHFKQTRDWVKLDKGGQIDADCPRPVWTGRADF